MRADFLVLGGAPLAETSDPITALLNRDWAALGGWSLFIMLALAIVLGSFRETWVPGARLRREEDRADKAEAALKLSQEALGEALEQNTKLLGSAEISSYVLREILPGIKAKGGDTS